MVSCSRYRAFIKNKNEGESNQMEEMIKTEKKQTGPDFTLEFINYESENTFDVKEDTFKENRIYHVKVICNDGRI